MEEVWRDLAGLMMGSAALGQTGAGQKRGDQPSSFWSTGVNGRSALKRGCFAFSTALVILRYYKPSTVLWPNPCFLLSLALRLETVGTTVQFKSKMFSLFSSLELLRLQIRCLYSQMQNNCVPQVWKMSTHFLVNLWNREANERDC